MNLRTRFSLVISSVIVFVLASLLLSIYLVERNHLLKESERSRLNEAQKFALVCQESYISKDEILLINYIKGMKRSPEVASAMFLDSDGLILNHSTVALKDKRMMDRLTQAAAMSESVVSERRTPPGEKPVVEYAVPVVSARGRIGTARIAYDAEALDARINQTLRAALERVLWIVLLNLLAGILVATAIARTLTRPIDSLSQGAREIARGNLAVKIPESRKDEIGELAQEFNLMAAKLGELDKMKDRFVETVSHDLRNPLGAISTAAGFLLTNSSMKKEAREQVVRIILDSANRLANMVNNILDAAKMKEGRLEFQMEKVSPEKIITEVASLYEFTARENEKTIRVELPPELPAVRADDEKIHRVLVNLLSNAMKFTKKGNDIVIGASANGKDGMVEFFLSDNGLGISEEDLPKLFQRYQYASRIDPLFRKKQGAGLGLSIVKSIVEAHGGRIWVESEQGRGTTFRWTIPMAEKHSRGDTV
jgi:signal transduction histidine kinase